MATNLKTSTDAVVLTRFYGGEKDKVCVQLDGLCRRCRRRMLRLEVDKHQGWCYINRVS